MNSAEKSRVRSRNDCQKVITYRKNSKLSLKGKRALALLANTCPKKVVVGFHLELLGFVT